MSNQGGKTSYRVLYGKLFSTLTRQYGIVHFSEIEDAIQNSFLKSVKKWSGDNEPKRKENWLYITARNDLLNQLKRKSKSSGLESFRTTNHSEAGSTDLRLDTILLVSSSNSISQKAKVIFVLKNIFGLSVREISDSTLIKDEAIYKMLKRSKESLQNEYRGKQTSEVLTNINKDEISTVEEILYAVFNSGFDSFNKTHKSLINKDLCLESFALTKILLSNYNQQSSTSNLLSLFCFHISRIDAKINEEKLIPFFNQDRSKWSKEMLNLGFHYLKRPRRIHRFYIEALIVSKYMSTDSYKIDFWNDVIKLYDILLQLSPSPIIQINYCFCLYKAHRKQEAIELLEKLEKELPSEHVYLSLLKAYVLNKTNPKKSEEITANVVSKMTQEIRQKHLLECNFINI